MDEKILSLIAKLETNTDNKSITWVHTSSETEYVTYLSKGSVSIDCWEYEGREYNELKIYNIDAVIVSELRFNESDEDFKILKHLHSLVHNKTNKIDETIDGLISELE